MTEVLFYEKSFKTEFKLKIRRSKKKIVLTYGCVRSVRGQSEVSVRSEVNVRSVSGQSKGNLRSV